MAKKPSKPQPQSEPEKVEDSEAAMHPLSEHLHGDSAKDQQDADLKNHPKFAKFKQGEN